jgi:hypothetical protein
VLLARMSAPLKPVRRALSMLTCDERTAQQAMQRTRRLPFVFMLNV